MYGLSLNNASWNGDIGFESLAEASCIIVKWLFISVYMQKKYHRSVRNVAMVVVAAVALSSATYAGVVSNNSVKATTTSIAAQSNSFVAVVSGLPTAKRVPSFPVAASFAEAYADSNEAVKNLVSLESESF